MRTTLKKDENVKMLFFSNFFVFMRFFRVFMQNRVFLQKMHVLHNSVLVSLPMYANPVGCFVKARRVIY